MPRRLFRKGSGRFRGPTLADFGMACCEKCRALFTPVVKDVTWFTDPRDIRKAQQFCAECGGSPESKASGLFVDPNTETQSDVRVDMSEQAQVVDPRNSRADRQGEQVS